MAQGNEFSTGGNIVDGQDSQPFWTQTHEDERYPLGTLRVEPADETANAEHTDGTALGLKGDRTWMFIRAKTALDPYMTVSIWNAAESYMGIKNATDDLLVQDVIGVVQTTVTDEYYCWVVVQGECIVTSPALSAGQKLDTHGATGDEGDVSSSTTAGQVFGKALTALGSPIANCAAARISLL